MPSVRIRGMMRTQHFWIRTSVVDCCCSSVSFVRIESNFCTIQIETQTQKMMDHNSEIRILWFLRIFFKFSKRRRAVPLQPIWTIMVAAKLDHSMVLVTKFHQNRSTLKGRSAGQRHRHTHAHTHAHTHRRAWLQYILRRLRLTQNVIIK